MIYLSKSKYIKLLQCEKLLWLDKYMPEKAEYPASVRRRFTAGNAVSELAKTLFGEYLDMTSIRPDGRLDINRMKANTRAAVESGAEIICEAAFEAEGLYCAVDILKKSDGGYELYEVKSSVHIKPNYISDAAYQVYVLGLAGVMVTDCYIVTINSDYIRNGPVDIKSMLRITEISDKIIQHTHSITQNINRARDVLSKSTPPYAIYGKQCRQPYECPFVGHCHGKLTEPSAFDIYCADKNGWTEKGYRTMRDVVAGGEPLSVLQQRQVEHTHNDLPTFADKAGINDFLSKLTYPLYFIDFETSMPEIPQFDGARPFMTLPFMFSLHYITEMGGDLHHFDILSEQLDPRSEIADALAEKIGTSGSIIAYNADFEKRVIADLGEQFPEYCKQFERMRERFIDFLDLFKGGMVYNKRMGGSFSLKSVLPALYPDDPSLDYSSLGEAAGGSDAMILYSELMNADAGQKEYLRNGLKQYCKLDTFALVKILEKLYDLQS